jgi:hypothetical protein
MAQTPEEKARAMLQPQVTAAAAAASAAGKHEGHWRLHHIALPGGPGGFTPYKTPECVEEELSPLRELVEHLAEVLGMDHVCVIADCGLEAGG